MENNVQYKYISTIYDIFDLIFMLGGKGNPRPGLLEVIRNTPQRILDVCVGTAESALLVAGRNNLNHVLGIDISDNMLEVARRKITQKKLSNLEVQKTSAADMHLAGSSFDVVMISFALHEFDKEMREKVFGEVARVLKPGGTFCVIDFARQASRSNRFFLKVWASIEPSCFADFLAVDWRKDLKPFGLVYTSEQEYSFSNLYVLHKALE